VAAPNGVTCASSPTWVQHPHHRQHHAHLIPPTPQNVQKKIPATPYGIETEGVNPTGDWNPETAYGLSYYTIGPQALITGTAKMGDGKMRKVRGAAWLEHQVGTRSHWFTQCPTLGCGCCLINWKLLPPFTLHPSSTCTDLHYPPGPRPIIH